MSYPQLEPTPGNLVLEIPFPYTQFTDTAFFLSETSMGENLFIPDDCYRRIDETHIELLDKSLNIKNQDEVRFTFAHQKNKRWIGKTEFHFVVEESGARTFQLPSSPYSALLDMNRRVYVFLNRKRYSPGIHYKFENTTGKLVVLTKSFRGMVGDRVDVMIIYQGNQDNRAIQNLPQSGYIYLANRDIDRNYSNDRMAVFVNGKLVDRDDIIRLSNGVYKISKDIGSTHDLDVRSLSPRVNSLVPYYKKMGKCKEIPNQEDSVSFPSRIEIPAKVPHNRKELDEQFNPIYIDPTLLKDPELWINVTHTSVLHNNPECGRLHYDFKLYGDDFVEEPSEIYIITQLRLVGETEFEKVSLTPVLIGLIDGQLSHTSQDIILASTQIKTILKCDRSRSDLGIDGIIGRLQANPKVFDEVTPVRYTLKANRFERGHSVCLLEWSITSEPNNKGIVYWKRHLWLTPDNKEDILAQKGDEINEF